LACLGIFKWESTKAVEQYKGTTILSVRRNNSVVIGGDGQVTMGDTVMKGNARKVRRLYNENVIAGSSEPMLIYENQDKQKILPE